jgi:methionyl aminopeptidase
MHEIGFHTDSSIQNNNNQVDFDLLFRAQEKSWKVLHEISNRIVPGMNELEAIQIAKTVLAEQGCVRSWHRPMIRFGANTVKPYFTQPDPKSVLLENDIFYVDIGPVWKEGDEEYEGDVGNTYVLGNDSKYLQCKNDVILLFEKAANQWRNHKISGQKIYQWLEMEAKKMNYFLVSEDDGHRIGIFPHQRIFSGGLSQVRFYPNRGLWVLEVHIQDLSGQFGAFYEDILR